MQIITIDDWFTGKFENTQPVDPPGCLSIGLSYDSRFILRQEVGVYSRTHEGTGTFISNEGQGYDGTLQAGSWVIDHDRVYLHSPTIKYEHHMSHYSMTGGVSGGISGRSIQGAMMRKGAGDTFFYFGIEGSVIQLRRKFYHTNKKVVGKSTVEETTEWWEILETIEGLFDPNEWHVYSFSISPTQWYIYVDGEVVADLDISDIYSVEEGEVWGEPDCGYPLLIGPLSGYVDEIGYLGRPGEGRMIDYLAPYSGTWKSQIFDLGGEYILHKLAYSAYKNSWQNISVTVRISDQADLEYFDEKAFGLDRDTHEEVFDEFVYYPGEGEPDWIKGRYMQVIARLSREKEHFGRPYIDCIHVHMRRQV